MGLLDRMTTVLKGRAREHLGGGEGGGDPGAALEAPLQTSERMLNQLEVALADLTAGRVRLDMQVEQLQASADGLEAQAKQALQQGREDLARLALTRRGTVTQQLTTLTAQRDALRDQQAKLALTQQRVEGRVEAFRAQKESLQAQYSAAEAQVKVGEAATGLSEDMADMELATQRADDSLQQMQARAEAIDELTASGTLPDVTAGSAPPAPAVDGELERLRRELGSGGQSAAPGGAG